MSVLSSSRSCTKRTPRVRAFVLDHFSVVLCPGGSGSGLPTWGATCADAIEYCLNHPPVYIAGRSQDKANQAISTTQAEHKNSTGSLHFLHVDLSDLTSIKTSAQDFLGRESALHVLWNNAGVMIPPKGSKGPQGHELQVRLCVCPRFVAIKLPAEHRTLTVPLDRWSPTVSALGSSPK